MRDLLILSVDKTRASDPDVVGESDRPRVLALVDRWSREDLLRGFDLLTRAEQEVRSSDQPRYNMEMALLRLMHLRKLVPLTELLAGGGRSLSSGADGPRGPVPSRAPDSVGASGLRMPARPSSPPPPRAAAPMPRPASAAVVSPTASPTSAPTGPYRDAFIAELKSAKPTFYNLVVAQAFSIEANASGVTFAFQPNQKVPKSQCEDNRAWVQSVIEKVVGQKLPVHIVFTDAGAGARGAAAAPKPAAAAPAKPAATGTNQSSALEHDTVKHLLEVFPVEKTTIKRVRPMDIQAMMKQAQEMQQRLQQQMNDIRVEATAGGGMVTVVVNGHKHLLKP